MYENTKRQILVLLPLETETEARARLHAAAPEAELTILRDFTETEDPTRYQIVIGTPPVEALPRFTRLEWLQLTSAGADQYVSALPGNILLTNATGAYGPAIAEHLLGMLLMMMKKLHYYRDNQSSALWRDEGPVVSLSGARVLAIGLGDLGCCFARLCTACGAHVTGLRRTPSGPVEGVAQVIAAEDPDGYLPDADVVALTLPQTERTRGLFNSVRLARMKPGAYLLNAGRGSAVDTEALCAALDSGRLAGAGLDVTDPEPLPAAHPLWRCRNAVITPHVSGGFHLPGTLDRIVDIAADNLRRYTEGSGLRNLVDRATGYRAR